MPVPALRTSRPTQVRTCVMWESGGRTERLLPDGAIEPFGGHYDGRPPLVAVRTRADHQRGRISVCDQRGELSDCRRRGEPRHIAGDAVLQQR